MTAEAAATGFATHTFPLGENLQLEAVEAKLINTATAGTAVSTTLAATGLYATERAPVASICVSCHNELQDGAETGVDCGGPGCGVGSDCQSGADCATGICGPDGTCKEPSYECRNGVKDDLESDVDCGGELCLGHGVTCGDGQACFVQSDCGVKGHCYIADGQSADGWAVAGVCFACENGVQDGDESDVDCGGVTGCRGCLSAIPATPDMCDGAATALTQQECEDSVGTCDVGAHTDRASCEPAVGRRQLADGRRRLGVYTPKPGVWAKASPGAPSEKYNGPGDCWSKSCAIASAGAAVGVACVSCINGVKDGDETDVDCGGSCIREDGSGKCLPPAMCGGDGDCVTGYCDPSADPMVCAIPPPSVRRPWQRRDRRRLRRQRLP